MLAVGLYCIKYVSVGETANVSIGLKQKISGVEMAITNCTVFDENYLKSYSVLDYPNCPDSLVKAQIPAAANQELYYSTLYWLDRPD